MKQKRRGFMMTVGFSTGLLGFLNRRKTSKVEKNVPYTAILRCDIDPSSSIEQFYLDQSKWENLSKVIEITDQYKQAGRLLSNKYSAQSLSVTWEYTFKSRLDFEDWYKEMFISGSFDPIKVPSIYTYSIDGYNV